MNLTIKDKTKILKSRRCEASQEIKLHQEFIRIGEKEIRFLTIEINELKDASTH